jgi:hypothetical protein
MLKRLVVMCAIAALLPGVALAATHKKKSKARSTSSRSAGPTVTWWGPRLGLSSSPDQFVIGGQLDFREVAPGLSISPNLEFGIGDNVTWTAVNGDLKHHFVVQGATGGRTWRGLSVNPGIRPASATRRAPRPAPTLMIFGGRSDALTGARVGMATMI